MRPSKAFGVVENVQPAPKIHCSDRDNNDESKDATTTATRRSKKLPITIRCPEKTAKIRRKNRRALNNVVKPLNAAIALFKDPQATLSWICATKGFEIDVGKFRRV